MGNEMIAMEAPLTALQIRHQVNLIQEVMKEVMQEGQHYGKIPGCGEKPTLLKPGAEKLSMVFRLRPIIDNNKDIRIEDLPDGHKNIHVNCHIVNMSGVELATGVGSCSTMESKFRYRGGEKISTGQRVPAEYWNLKKEGKMSEAIEKIGGTGFGVSKINGQWEVCEIGQKMENPDIADVYNTVLKMSKKRAYIDGILSATGASDCFTQDIEDMNPADLGKGSFTDAETTSTKTTPPPVVPVVHKMTPNSSPDEQAITKEQGEALMTLLRANGYNAQDLKEMIFFDFNIEKLSEIKNKHLIAIRKSFANPKPVEK